MFLLSQGADPEATNFRGWSSVHFASQSGDIPSITLLLNKGLNVNCTTSDGSTPLIYAARFGHDAAASYLLSQGEDFHDFNFNGQM